MIHAELKTRAIVAAVASAVALTLTACGERPAQDKFGQSNPPRTTPGPDMMSKSDTAPATDAAKPVDDASVTAKVKSALVAEPDLKATSINVDTAGGVVTLKGTTDSQEKRQKAAQVASNVEGVRSVVNQLVVVKG